MFCNFCGKQIGDDAKFCSYCGKSLVVPKIKIKKCPGCGIEYSVDKIFCEQCGTSLIEYEKEKTEESQKADVTPKQEEKKPKPQNEGSNPLKTIKMMSWYTGEPKVGIAKASGTLNIYEDRLELVKKLGNAAGAALFGAVGAMVSANKAKKQGSIDTYHYKDIAEVRKGTYGGMMPSIVITLKNGEKHSFVGTMNGTTIKESIEIIEHYLKN